MLTRQFAMQAKRSITAVQILNAVVTSHRAISHDGNKRSEVHAAVHLESLMQTCMKPVPESLSDK